MTIKNLIKELTLISAPVSDVVSLVEQIVFDLPNTFLILDIFSKDH